MMTRLQRLKRNPVCWLAVVVVALASCGKSSGPASAVSHAMPEPPFVSTCEPGQPGGRLVLAVTAPPRTFNPVFAPDAASDQIARLLFAGLVQFDFAKQEVVPGLAESWSVAPDGRTWTFKLRRGLRWSDGHALTSDDVVFTWTDVIYNPRIKAPLAAVFRIGNRNFSASAPDARTVVAVTPEVFAPFLEFFGTVPVLPRHALGDAAKRGSFSAAYGVSTRPDKIIGAGAFHLKEHRPGQLTVLERNPEFWATDRAGRRLPYFDEVHFVVTNPVAQLLSGHSDVCERIRPEEFAPLQAASAQGRFRLVEVGSSVERDFLWFNQNTNVNRIAGTPFVAPHKLAWFRNTAFRQAVACALDRERIVREIFGGRAVPCETYLGPETARWNNPNVPRFGFNRQRARALLAQAGLQERNGDGVVEDAQGRPCEITLLTNAGNPARERIAAFIADDLRQVGVKLDVQLLPFVLLERKVNDEFTYEAALMGLSGGGSDPASHLGILRSDDPMHQWFPGEPAPSTAWEARVDALMDAQMRTLDFAARKKSFDEVQAILGEQLPMIYTVTPILHAAARPDLANLRPAVLSATPLTWNAEELYFKKP